MPEFDLQPTLENQFVKIRPLQSDDFELLYTVASDPLLWEQHPNKERYQRVVFENFFKGALESKGAFVIYDADTGAVIGSSRYYDYDPATSSVLIGYTFISRDHWGSTYNQALKKLMVEYALQFVDQVYFHIGAFNIRSQRAIEKFGAVKQREIPVEYYGEQSQPNFEYKIDKKTWTSKR